MNIKNKVIRPNQLIKQLQISKSTLWRWRADPDFPQPILLGSRSIGFLTKDVDAWLLMRKRKTEKGEV